MKKTAHEPRFADLPPGYRELCGILLPRPIHDKIQYQNSMELLEGMAGFEDEFSRDQADYFKLLADLVLDYEEELQKPSAFGELPLRTRLQNLLESTRWSASDLGRFLGLDATMGNKIMRGERSLTTEHVRKLSAHFSLQAEYFL